MARQQIRLDAGLYNLQVKLPNFILAYLFSFRELQTFVELSLYQASQDFPHSFHLQVLGFQRSFVKWC